MKSVLASLLVVFTLFGSQSFFPSFAEGLRPAGCAAHDGDRKQLGDVCVSAGMGRSDNDLTPALVFAADRHVAPLVWGPGTALPPLSAFPGDFARSDFATARPPFGDVCSPPPERLA